MKVKKKQLLPILGMCLLILLIGISYLNNNLFMEKLIPCGIVLGLIFLIRITEPVENMKDSSFDNFQKS